MLNFPGCSSKQVLHYIDIHLEDKSIDTALLHDGGNMELAPWCEWPLKWQQQIKCDVEHS